MTSNLKRPRNEIRDLQLKQELRSAVKTAIYRITTAFGEHISSISLTPENKQKIESYQNYLEG